MLRSYELLLLNYTIKSNMRGWLFGGDNRGIIVKTFLFCLFNY